MKWWKPKEEQDPRELCRYAYRMAWLAFVLALVGALPDAWQALTLRTTAETNRAEVHDEQRVEGTGDGLRDAPGDAGAAEATMDGAREELRWKWQSADAEAEEEAEAGSEKEDEEAHEEVACAASHVQVCGP